MLSTIGDELKKVFLAGVGAMAVTFDKSKELIDELVEKGEITIEQGKVLNEELKHNVKETMNEARKTKKEADTKNMMADLEKMSADELEAFEVKIQMLKKQKNEESDQAEVIR